MDTARFLSPEEFAAKIGISLKTVYRRCWAGQLPAHQMAGPRSLWRIDYHAFLRQLDSALVPTGVSGDDQRSVCDSSGEPEFISGPTPKWLREENLER